MNKECDRKCFQSVLSSIKSMKKTLNKQQLLGLSLVVLVEGTVRPPGYCQDVAGQETQVN